MAEFFAEIGNNYIEFDGYKNLDRAIRLIKAAKTIGCKGVKFQYFKAEKLWHKDRISELQNAKNCELNQKWIEKLSKVTRNHGLLFGLSVFHPESIPEVIEHVDYLKIASFEAGRIDLIKTAHESGAKRLMLSLGQVKREEIHKILLKDLSQNKTHIDLLHCVSKYPCTPNECNLNIIKKHSPFINGWSDHSASPTVVYTAIACGAKVIEFHLDLDDRCGIETVHSFVPKVAEIIVMNSKIIESALGSPDWDKFSSEQNLEYKANIETGLRG